MHENLLISYGVIIRKIRQRNKISQEELAALCGLHRTYISDIELGKRNVSLENIDKIAQALGVRISDIFIEVEQYESIQSI